MLYETSIALRKLHRLGETFSTPTVLDVIGQHDAASLCLQFQSWNLRMPLQLHKYKSPSRKATQLNSPKKDRKGEKADMPQCPQRKIFACCCVDTISVVHKFSFDSCFISIS